MKVRAKVRAPIIKELNFTEEEKKELKRIQTSAQLSSKPRNWVPLTISIPQEMMAQLDYLRNDVTRSRYIQRIFRDHMQLMEMELSG